ncbi:hypothetical protein ABGB14_44030 [Nonomuraea sp. B10E15]|uniref:hypothetical protein n=1 Tax=Nonomuraea sp. B10E15 TaxID=3153560 RepID=UPI00325E7AB3
MRLERVEGMTVEAFEAYGVDEARIVEIRQFVQGWVEDLKLRRVDDGDAGHDDPDLPDID